MLAASQGGTSGVGWRWARLADALHTRSAKIVVIGGSITAGNGLHAGEQKLVLFFASTIAARASLLVHSTLAFDASVYTQSTAWETDKNALS